MGVVKFLLPEVSGNVEVRERFLREAQSAIRRKGEHVARVMDVGTMPDGLPYIVMEFLDGTDLGCMIEKRGALPVGEAIDYILPVCEALTEAHAHRIVHRDIKPANIFLTRRLDGSPLVKVLDFGISKAEAPRGGSLTRSCVIMGTPAYMSPEQMRSARDVGPAADIWALGIVLFECLTGRRPFDSDSFPALALSIAMDPTPRLHARVPSDLARAVYRCLEKEPSARFASMAELAAALAPYAADRRAASTIVERTQLMRDGAAAAGPVAPGNQMPGRDSTRGRRRLAIRSAIIAAPVMIATVWLIVRPGSRPEDGAARPPMGLDTSLGLSLSDPAPARTPASAAVAPAAPKLALLQVSG
jgi:serine/threonine-protein kinase